VVTIAPVSRATPPAGEVRGFAAATNAEHNLAYATALGGRIQQNASIVAVDIGGPLAFLNSVVPTRAVSTTEVMEAAAAYAGRPHVVVDYFDALDLADHGYQAGAERPIMVRSPGSTTPASDRIAIERVGDEVALAEAERILIDGMQLTPYADSPPGCLWAPPVLRRDSIRLYVGRVGGRAVTTAVAVVLDDCVGIFGVATLPEYRRRGYGAAVTSVALAAAEAVPSVLTSTPMGERVYAALGFVTTGLRRSWLWPGSAASE
jgi:GNAT superfamily N-acetyltransferase